MFTTAIILDKLICFLAMFLRAYIYSLHIYTFYPHYSQNSLTPKTPSFINFLPVQAALFDKRRSVLRLRVCNAWMEHYLHPLSRCILNGIISFGVDVLTIVGWLRMQVVLNCTPRMTALLAVAVSQRTSKTARDEFLPEKRAQLLKLPVMYELFLYTCSSIIQNQKYCMKVVWKSVIVWFVYYK